MSEATKETRTVKVFVLLGYGFGADSWQRRFSEHRIPGLNERLPYGYHHACGEGWEIEYSQDREESHVVKLIRRISGRIFGFDFIHVWRNRSGLRSADVVWTHTEREHLAVLLLYRMSLQQKRPKLIAQCVWLFDRWNDYSSLRRRSYRYLLRLADVITTQSPADLALAQSVLPDSTTALILSGATVDGMAPVQRRPIHRPIRLAALGNDMHRDWETLVEAFAQPALACEVRIASTKASQKLLRGLPHFSLIKAAGAVDIRNLYQWADIVIVPLKFNRHASGITVVFEAVVSGVPVVCTDTGGLRAYFTESEVCYVPLESPCEMREAVKTLAEDDDARFRLAFNAQNKLHSSDLTKRGYAYRHKALSQALLLAE